MFKALDRPHYDTLQLNRSKSKKTQGPQARQVSTLADLAAVTLNWHSAKLEDGMQDIPRHLLPHILKLAILNDQAWAVITLIANWPFQTLRFSDILNTEEAEVFEDEMAGINYFVLDGLTGRTKACKLTCLDFTNIILLITCWTASTNIILRKSLSVITCWTASINIILRNSLSVITCWTGSINIILLITCWTASINIIPRKSLSVITCWTASINIILRKSLSVITCWTASINIIPRKSLSVITCWTASINIIPHTSLVRQMIQAWPLLSLTKSKLKPKTLAKTVAKTAGLDQVKLSFEIIPKILAERLDNDVIRFATSRIKLPREIIDGDIITDSLAPFVVLKGQNAETLEGLSLQQLEEGILWLVIDDLCRFTRLTALDLQDCNIYLQEGKTRARTSTRARLSNTLKCLTSLRRLNLASNYLVGCLGEILDAVQNPLQFLGIRSCDLDQSDLSSLEQSKHAASIRELNISKLCHFSLFGSDNLTPSDVLKMVKHFPNVTVLNLAQNHLTDSGMGDFLQTLPKLTSLKGLDLSGNNLQLDSHLSLARACAHIPVMQWLRLSSVDRLNLDEFLENLNFGNQEMEGKIMNAMKELGREDISVNILPPSVAIMVDLVDFFD
ncbi:LRC14-like protein [Mya arenaria]|uniref:Leucine-rich repeat-containing protein 14 n=1 Tax=Mya arenaria TaxID=6604 RepID=A0ABY7F7A2_MYAAR|nr:LRC14-like protein [Mya arenaria]